MKDWEQAELAWDLVDVVAPELTHYDHTAICTNIGAGDYHTAIETLLGASADGGFDVPPQLQGKLARWLDAYAHSDDQSRLRRLAERFSQHR